MGPRGTTADYGRRNAWQGTPDWRLTVLRWLLLDGMCRKARRPGARDQQAGETSKDFLSPWNTQEGIMTTERKPYVLPSTSTVGTRCRW